MRNITAAIRDSAERGCYAGNLLLAWYKVPATLTPIYEQHTDMQMGLDAILTFDYEHRHIPSRMVGVRTQDMLFNTFTLRNRGQDSEYAKRKRQIAHQPMHLTLHTYYYPHPGKYDNCHLARTSDVIAAVSDHNTNGEDGTPFTITKVRDLPCMSHSRWDDLGWNQLPDRGWPGINVVEHITGWKGHV